MISLQGAYTASLPVDVCFDREVPFTRIPKDRRYASVAFDLDSGLYVAGGLYDTVFMNFDDEGQPVFADESKLRLIIREERHRLITIGSAYSPGSHRAAQLPLHTRADCTRHLGCNRWVSAVYPHSIAFG